MTSSATPSGGFITPSSTGDNQLIPESMNNRIGGLEDLTKNILVVIVVSVAAMVVATVGAATAIVIDQLHFNNELYRDGNYTRTNTVIKTETVTNQPVIFPNMKPNGQ